MKFTRDICRLLGFGGGDKELEAQDGASDAAGVDSSEATVNDEEGLDDEERARRRVERRRAKRKPPMSVLSFQRQKERRKLEREENMEEAVEQKEEADAAESESDSGDEYKEAEPRTAVRPRNKCNPESVAALVTTENKNNRRSAHRTATTKEAEPEWDVSSAFVANAASHIKLKGPKSLALLIAREDKENDAQSSQAENMEEMKRRGEALTGEGIEMFGQGRYSEAVDMFTEAIHCDPRDHRFYGNRSYCYWCLEQFSSALRDAQRSIELAPDWPKGHFRKGCALMGLKRYSEAEKSMEQVLNLDQRIKEASSRLVTCRILQLTDLGFEEERSKLLLEKFATVQGVLASSEVKAQKQTSPQDQSGCRSLWVGNITLEVTEKDLWELFMMFGEIESIRVLHERFCAFVNFKKANMAARALEKLQGVELASTKLVMRYPDRRIQQRTNAGLGFGTAATQQSSASTGSRQRAPANGDGCVHRRSTGCVHGDEYHFRHQQGRSRKPWQP